jgi:hypothetical protein
MAHHTTMPAPVPTVGPGVPRASMDQGDGPGRPCVDVDGQRVCVRTPRVSTQWLPDTPSHRHLSVVWFRLRVDAQGKPLCTLQA